MTTIKNEPTKEINEWTQRQMEQLTISVQAMYLMGNDSPSGEKTKNKQTSP